MSAASELARITRTAELLRKLQDEHAELEAAAKAKKKELLAVEREDLPELMNEVGMTEFKLEDGTVVKVAPDCSCGFTDATRAAALKWLIDNDFGGLIKTEVSIAFGRGDREEAVKVRDALKEEHEGVVVAEDVHHSTLKSFVKEQLQKGTDIPHDLFNIHPYDKAVLTAPKKPSKKRASKKPASKKKSTAKKK